MPKFVIERAIPEIGASKAAELQAISQKSCSVLRELGPDVQWLHSYLTGLLFEDAEDPLAALRWNLSELRRLLGNADLRGDVLELSLELTAYVDVEVVTFGTWAEALWVPGLDRELLEGMSFSSSPSFDVWL